MDGLPPNAPPDVASCMVTAEVRYRVPRQLLYAVALKERAGAGAVVKTRKGTRDLGRMQINTANLPTLAKFGITERGLLEDDCLNIQVGAWKLATLYSSEQVWPRAIARYNVGSLNTPGRIRVGTRYATDVLAYWKTLSLHYPI